MTQAKNRVHPLIYELVAFSVGVLFSFVSGISFLKEAGYLGGAVVLSAHLLSDKTLRAPSLLLFAFLIGVFAYQKEARVNHRPELLGTFSAYVTTFPEKIERGFSADVTLENKVNARLLFLGERAPERGDHISFSTRLRHPRSYGNEFEFDPELNSIVNRIAFVGSVESDAWLKTDPPSTARERLRNQLRKQSVERAENFLSDENVPFFQSFVLGDHSFITDSTIDVFRKCGITHLLVVSGFQVTLVSILFGFLTGVLWSRSVFLIGILSVFWVRLLAGAGGAVLFASILNLELPLMRALIAFLLAGGAFVLNRRARMQTLLVLTLGVILIASPASLLGPSTQLSFAAVSGIGLGLEFLRLRKIKPSKLISFIAASVGAYLGTLPVVITHFTSFTTYALIGNLLFAPLLGTIATAAGVAAVFLIGPFEFVGNYLLCLFDQILCLTTPLVESLASFPTAEIYIPPPTWISILGYCLFLYLLSSQLKTSVLLLSFLMMVSPYVAQFTSRPDSEIHFLHVGQGDAAVITTREGHTALIDTGPGGPYSVDAGKRIIEPWLKSHGISALDLLVLSHSDLDHVGGAPRILERFSVAKVWVPYSSRKGVLSQIRNLAMRRGAAWSETGRRGESFVLGHIRIAPLFPFAEDSYPTDRDNNRSLVVRVDADGMHALFTGDIEMEAEAQLIQTTKKSELSANILKVAHHGSRTSSSEQFLRNVGASEAVITAGFQNRFGHPSQEVLKRLDREFIRVWRGDESGEVGFRARGGEYEFFTVKRNSDHL